MKRSIVAVLVVAALALAATMVWSAVTRDREYRRLVESGDAAVREMIARAAASTPEEIVRLHGRVEIRDPEPEEDA